MGKYGGRFQSLSEPWASTTTHVCKLIMAVFAGIAEFERDLIRERTSASREAARRRGIHLGRPQQAQHRAEKLGAPADKRREIHQEIADTLQRP